MQLVEENSIKKIVESCEHYFPDIKVYGSSL
jgi:hypothetical protein